MEPNVSSPVQNPAPVSVPPAPVQTTPIPPPPPVTPPSTPQIQLNKNFKPLSLIILGLVLIVAGGAYYFMQRTPSSGPAPLKNYSERKAATGELAKGFPRELIIMNDAKIVESGSFGGLLNKNEVSGVFASYRTSGEINALQKAYVDLANSNNWSVFEADRLEDGSYSLSVRRDREFINIYISEASSDEREVYITLTANTP